MPEAWAKDTSYGGEIMPALACGLMCLHRTDADASVVPQGLGPDFNPRPASVACLSVSGWPEDCYSLNDNCKSVIYQTAGILSNLFNQMHGEGVKHIILLVSH